MLRKIFSRIVKIKYKLDNSSGSWLLINSFLDDYKKYPFMECLIAHKYGFTVDDYNILDIKNRNSKEYLTSIDYYKMHPINKNFSSWIDDKLTIKYLCQGSSLEKYMPKYYFLIEGDGNIISLIDYEGKENTCSSIVDLLAVKGELAFKKTAGSIGEGFYKAEYKNGKYFLNELELNKDNFIRKVNTLKDYIVTEYLHPHPSFNIFCNKNPNTIRYLCAKLDNEYIMVKSYIRFGTKKTGQVENYNGGGVLCYVDSKGLYNYGNIIKNNKNKIIYEHPDTKEKLNGKIPMWAEILEAVKEFCTYFPQFTYLGFDFVVTSDNRVIILEINSLTSLDSLQLDGSILKSHCGKFYKEKIKD